MFEINKSTSNRCPMSAFSRTKACIEIQKSPLISKLTPVLFIYLFIFNSNVGRIEMPWECGPLLLWLATWNKEVPWFWSQIFVNPESQTLQNGEGARKQQFFTASLSNKYNIICNHDLNKKYIHDQLIIVIQSGCHVM